MSAYNVSDAHIRYLVRAYHRYTYTKPTLDELQDAATMLRNANVQSVNYRYQDEREPFMVSDLVPTFALNWADVINDRYADRLNPVQVLKAINCLEYQSCETPDWTSSPAYEWLQALAHLTISKLDGYDDAAWEIPDAPQAADTIKRLI